jgi:hypothetical protein
MIKYLIISVLPTVKGTECIFIEETRWSTVLSNFLTREEARRTVNKLAENVKMEIFKLEILSIYNEEETLYSIKNGDVKLCTNNVAASLRQSPTIEKVTQISYKETLVETEYKIRLYEKNLYVGNRTVTDVVNFVSEESKDKFVGNYSEATKRASELQKLLGIGFVLEEV